MTGSEKPTQLIFNITALIISCIYLRSDRAASTQLPQIEQPFNGLLAELPVVLEKFCWPHHYHKHLYRGIVGGGGGASRSCVTTTHVYNKSQMSFLKTFFEQMLLNQ